MNVHVLIQESTGKSKILGVVLDPVDLAHLMYDPHAMPADCQLTEREAMLGADGLYYWAGLSKMVAAPVFSLAAHEAAVAADDAFVSTAPQASRERLFPGHKPEAEKRAERAALRAAHVDAVMLKKQDDSNALTLEVALAAIAEAPDAAAARAAVAAAASDASIDTHRAKKAAAAAAGNGKPA